MWPSDSGDPQHHLPEGEGCFGCHSGLDPESRISELDSRFRGNDDLVANVKKPLAITLVVCD